MKHHFMFSVGRLFAFATLVLSTSIQAAPYEGVAARFVTTTCAIPCVKPQQGSWYFWRGENRVEIRDGTSDVGEIWRRDNKGRTNFVYVEPTHKRGIEYNASDLRIINHTRPWERLASIVSPDELKKLTLVGEKEVLGYKAQRYSGKMDKRTVDVVWVPSLQLATKVVNTYPDRKVTTELKSFLTKQDAVTATTDAQLASYALVDFSDLGDMETNETMAWLKQATAAPGHETHEH
ncbi:MAG: hypothetical protein ACYC4K_05560 [Thiobacillus sp.]